MYGDKNNQTLKIVMAHVMVNFTFTVELHHEVGSKLTK